MKLFFAIFSCLLTLLLVLAIGSEWTVLGTLLFVSGDLFLITILASLPWIVLVVRSLPDLVLLRGALSAAGLLTLLSLALPLHTSGLQESSEQTLFLWRFLCAGLVALLLVLQGDRFLRTQKKRLDEQQIKATPLSLTAPWPAWIAVVLMGLIISGTYTAFLKHNYEKQLTETLPQGRVEAARSLAHRWSRLSPEAKWQGQSVRELHLQLSRHCQQLRIDLANAPQPDTLAMRGQLIQAYVSLEEFSAAESLLQPLLHGSRESALAWDTLGLICQRKKDWEQSLQAYERALLLWQTEQQKDSPEKDSGLPPEVHSGLVSAYRGIAFAQRQLGQNQLAAATYQKLIELAPTADNHFLLAQFYEDAQQTSHAEQHARQAAALAPGQFAEPARKLLQQMESAHFGCFRVYQHR